MKTRPILFNGEMVRAILDGRKTQTRRIVKPQSSILTDSLARWLGVQPPKKQNLPVIPCHYGQPGDILRVRETARVIEGGWRDRHTTRDRRVVKLRYEADGAETGWITYPDRLARIKIGNCIPNGCYNEACRLLLEITDIRIEQLQGISEEDAKIEGAFKQKRLGDGLYGFNPPKGGSVGTYRDGFRFIWDNCYGPGSWDANPWVWVIKFRKL